MEICNKKSRGTFVDVVIIRFSSSKIFAPRIVVSLQLLCLNCFFYIYIKEWDSFVCIGLPFNKIMNLRVPSLFERVSFSQ